MCIKKVKKYISVSLLRRISAGLGSVILMCGLMATLSAARVSAAASYSGRGSKSDPYLVQTPQQLDGIRNNLTAHYKLANTIDLAGFGQFTPIGSLKTPFKGSLSCDFDSSGKPKYAIKNLKVKVNPAGADFASEFSGYKEDGSSGWEAGLFGYADGASFIGIRIFDADIENKVEGKYQTYQSGGAIKTNKGTNDQGAGILIGLGNALTITGCGVSGKVVSASNHVGGMGGRLTDSTIKQCYSYATVISTGSWGTGGLIATVNGTTVITECFYDGTLTGGLTHAGAFAGSVYSGKSTTIKNCWSAGVVKTESSGCFLGTKVHSDTSSLTNIDVASQCYTMSVIEGRTKLMTNKTVTNANYAAAEPGVLEIGFAVATKDELNGIFKDFGVWEIQSGHYPMLKNIRPVTDASAYKMQEVSQLPTAAGGNNQPNNTDPDQEGTPTESGESPGETQDGSLSDETAAGDVTAASNDLVFNSFEDTSMLQMSVAERILVIALVSVFVLSTAGSVVTMVLILKSRREA